MASESQESTSSDSELEKFNKIANLWWDTSGPFSKLHELNPPRLRFITEHLARHYNLNLELTKPLNGLDVLDIGCGGGILCEPLARLGANVTGIDSGPENILAAQEHAKKVDLKITYLTILPEQMAQKKKKFDLVLNMEVVEHTKNLDLFLECSSSLVCPNGVMAVSTLNRTMKSFIFAKLGAEYVLRWLPIGTHSWNKFIKPNELFDKLNHYNLVIKDVAGISYYPLENNWQINNDLSVNYIAFGVKKN